MNAPWCVSCVSVCPCVCLPVSLCVSFCVCVCLPVSVSLCLCFSVCVSACLSAIPLSVCLSICLCVYLPICVFACLPVCPCVCACLCMCACLPVCLSLCLCVCLCTSMCTKCLLTYAEFLFLSLVLPLIPHLFFLFGNRVNNFVYVISLLCIWHKFIIIIFQHRFIYDIYLAGIYLTDICI